MTTGAAAPFGATAASDGASAPLARHPVEAGLDLLGELLGDSRKLLRSLLDNSPAVMFVKDLDGRYLLINPLFERIFALTGADIIGRTDHDLFPKDFADRFRANDLAAIASGDVIVAEEVVQQTDGIHVYTSVKFPLRDAHGEPFAVCGVASDISQRKRAETELRLYADIVHHMHVGLYVWRLEDRARLESFRLVATNPAATRLTGVPMDDLLGRTMPETFPQVLERGIAATYREVIVSGRARDLGDVAYEDARIPKKVFAAKLFPLPGDCVGVAFEDVTGQRRLEGQLRQAQKLEAVGRLAGGVAHDFNNLLTAILGYADLCVRRLGPAHPLQGSVEGIRRAAERGAALVQQLLAFGRRQVLVPEPTDLAAVSHELGGMLDRLIDGRATFAVTVAPGGPWLAVVDRSQLERVIVNLVLNAREACAPGGRIDLEIGPAGPADQTETGDRGAPGAQPELVAMRVRDDGKGMDEETQRRIFEPFFTTREQSGGTGLGLASVYGIVEQSHGRVRVVSAPGAGTTVSVLLPAALASANRDTALGEAAGEAAGEAGSEAGSEDASATRRAAAEPWEPLPSAPSGVDDAVPTILVTEDEPLVRGLVCELLRTSGYRVFEAASGAEALAVLDRDGLRIDLLLTDLVMPGMGGRELVARACARRPDLRVLHMSGYTAEGAQPQPFLAKPFTPTALLAAVMQAIASPALG